MKLLKMILGFVLLIIVLGAVFIVILIRSVDVNWVKSYLIKELSSNLNRSVQIQSIRVDFNLKEKFSLFLNGLQIADDPSFSSDPFLKMDRVQLDVALLSLITQRQFVLNQIVIQSPQLAIQRNSDGQWNFQNIGRKPEPKAKSEQPGKETLTSREDKSDESSLKFYRIKIRSIELKNGVMTFTDNSFPEPWQEKVSLDLQVFDFSLDRPFKFNCQLSPEPNADPLAFNGTVQMNLKNRQVRFDDIQLNVNFAKLPLMKWLSSWPEFLNQIKWQEGFQGKVSLLINQLIVGEDGLKLLSAEGKLREGRISLTALPQPLTDMEGEFQVSENDVILRQMHLYFGEGGLQAEGHVDNYSKDPMWSFEVKLENLNISDLLVQEAWPVKVSGKLTAHLNGEAEGISLEALRSSLKVEGEADLKEGKFAEVNLIKILFGRLAQIPYIALNLEQQIPPEYRDILAKEETPIESMHLNLKIKDETIQLNPVKLVIPDLDLQGQARCDFQQKCFVQASVLFSRTLSDHMRRSAPEWEALINAQGQIYIPLSAYQGKLSEIKIYPDLAYLSKRFIVHRGREELRGVLEQVLPDREEKDQQTQEDAPQSPGEGVLDLLESIFP